MKAEMRGVHLSFSSPWGCPTESLKLHSKQILGAVMIVSSTVLNVLHARSKRNKFL